MVEANTKYYQHPSVLIILVSEDTYKHFDSTWLKNPYDQEKQIKEALTEASMLIDTCVCITPALVGCAYQCIGLCVQVCQTHSPHTEKDPVLADTAQEALLSWWKKEACVYVYVCVLCVCVLVFSS